MEVDFGIGNFFNSKFKIHNYKEQIKYSKGVYHWYSIRLSYSNFPCVIRSKRISTSDLNFRRIHRRKFHFITFFLISDNFLQRKSHFFFSYEFDINKEDFLNKRMYIYVKNIVILKAILRLRNGHSQWLIMKKHSDFFYPCLFGHIDEIHNDHPFFLVTFFFSLFTWSSNGSRRRKYIGNDLNGVVFDKKKLRRH